MFQRLDYEDLVAYDEGLLSHSLWEVGAFTPRQLGQKFALRPFIRHNHPSGLCNAGASKHPRGMGLAGIYLPWTSPRDTFV